MPPFIKFVIELYQFSCVIERLFNVLRNTFTLSAVSQCPQNHNRSVDI